MSNELLQRNANRLVNNLHCWLYDLRDCNFMKIGGIYETKNQTAYKTRIWRAKPRNDCKDKPIANYETFIKDENKQVDIMV